MQRVLDREVAIVTGSESGIGQSIAVLFGASGAHVVVDEFAYPERARQTVELIEKAGGRAVAVHADVRAENDVERLFAAAERQFGPVTILVNDAGINGHGKEVIDMDLHLWQETIGTNLTGPFLLSRRFMRSYREAGRRGGRIINISSVHETMPMIGSAEYCATKGGLMMFMRTLALEAAKFSVTVNNIGPGAILTPMNQELKEDPQKRKEQEKTIPLGRVGEPDDIGRVALFLAGPDAAYITGTTVFADGGLLLNVGSGPYAQNAAS